MADALGRLAQVNPQLAGKVQPAAAGQLALLHAADALTQDHMWKYLGQEQKAPHAVFDVCVRCGVQRHTVRRFTKALITYAARGTNHYSVLLPACGRQQSSSAGAKR